VSKKVVEMSAQSNASVTIIKRKKVIADAGHHGGAWKVAYADFVTAMMAFFLLMWLLNATTEKQRKGIAEYFSPTVPIARISGGGEGSLGGDSVFSENTLPKMGTGASSVYPTESRMARGGQAADEAEMTQLMQALTGGGGGSLITQRLLAHIAARITPEGLRIDIHDLPDAPLFEGETAAPTPLLVELAQVMVQVFSLVQNPFGIEGHVARQPIVRLDNTVWELSLNRADQLRKLMADAQLDPARIDHVSGHGDTRPNGPNPMDLRNNRLSVSSLI
jgi:chemotaxis protein MotB